MLFSTLGSVSHQVITIVSSILALLILIWMIMLLTGCMILIRLTRHRVSIHPNSEIDNREKPVIEEFPCDRDVVKGESISFKVSVRGKPELKLQWYFIPISKDGPEVCAAMKMEEDIATGANEEKSVNNATVEEDNSNDQKYTEEFMIGDKDVSIPISTKSDDDTDKDTEFDISNNEQGNRDGGDKSVSASDQSGENKESVDVKLSIKSPIVLGEDENEDNLMVKSQQSSEESSNRVPVNKFKQYVAYNHTNSNAGFNTLFSNSYKGSELPASYGRSAKNEHLNRYRKITVYDHNRIVLHPELQHSTESFISACYIEGYLQPRYFIATQGPMKETLVDFWWMVWQERPSTIVMLTNLKEGTHTKCTQYWPNKGHKSFGIFVVTIIDCQNFCDYCVRTLLLTMRSQTTKPLKVKQYQLISWPKSDHSSAMLFYKNITAQHNSSQGPILVHCSAGVGRTGIFICINNVMEQIKEEKIVDIHGVIDKMRRQRMMMVQNLEQYIYVHEIILEHIVYGDTQIFATDLESKISELCSRENSPMYLEKQFQLLNEVPASDMQCSIALKHLSKNRLVDNLPLDAHLVNGTEDEYIHAVYAKGYLSRTEYIIAEDPMKSTVKNMWRTIFDNRCRVIVMLSQPEEDGMEYSYQYWPSPGDSKEEGGYKVELIDENWRDDFVIRSLVIHQEQLTHSVTQFQITCWKPDGECSNFESVLNIITEIAEIQEETRDIPLFVHCSDTITRSGIFCAVANTINQYKAEGVIDIFQTVRALRICKPGAVPTVGNYRMIHDVVMKYSETTIAT